jgi:large subunit ribosomal protein L15
VKLHDLKPAPGSRKPKRRVGRGIAAGQGKTAGRGTKGQKARAGGKIPAWFEGGQTPLHQRIPKLRGFRNPFKIQYEVVNIGDIARLVELGELEPGDMPGGSTKGSRKGSAPITVNQEILRAAGLVRRLDRPMKVLGGGELSAALFVVADAFSSSARTKIEGAGGTVSVLEVPDAKRKALGVADDASTDGATTDDAAAATAETTESPADAAPAEPSKPARAKRGGAKSADESATELTADETAAVEAALAQTAVAADEAPADEPVASEVAAGEAAADGAPAKPRASRKPKTPKPETDA